MAPKQKLHKRIILPFILFTVIFTILFTAFFVIYISKLFNQKEQELVQQSFYNIESELNNMFKSNKIIFDNIEPNNQILSQLQDYLIGNAKLNHFNVFNSETIDIGILNQLKQISTDDKKQELIRYRNGNQTSISIFQQFATKDETYYIEFSLNKALNSIQSPKQFNIGLMLIDSNNKRQLIFSNQNKENLSTKQAIKAFETKNIKRLKNNVIESNQQKIIFNPTTQFPSLYTFIYTDSSNYLTNLIIIVIACISLIALMSLSIFFIYSIIIKRITTSIEILGTVSKKVAKGDFNQKVYIDRNDEIGTLAQSFNAMIEQLNDSTNTIIDQKEQSEAIITCVPDGVIVTDLFNNLILANKQAESIFDIEFTKLIGKNLIIHLKNEQFQYHCDQLQKDSQVTSEFSLERQKERYHYLMTSTQVKNDDNKSIGIVYLLRDITREKQIGELQDGFLRTVSHELRTPLTSVIGFIELALHSNKDDLPDNKKQFLDTAHKEASNLKTLINDLLDLSQIQAGNSKMFYKKINVKTLINSIITSLKPLTKSKELDLLNKDIDDSLNIQADESKVRRILINLISNSIKFTEKGYISVTCIEKENYLEFEVADTGIGIQKNEHDLIFEKFRQVDYSKTRQYEGIGLGLSIVKELVEMHNGTISVESDLGKGSTFRFTLRK
ncbi:MAG: hypothetical protein CMP39_07995 [Rickettsiales bacterium]|nr:hypothetical protein [Rickettsiales bacterium]|tara:strand:+ start:7500 stop:9509 length:2010 start_codon:yes stop_codon:yes gene_type:complete